MYMLMGRDYYFFVIYAGVIVIYSMVKAAEKDIYAPNDALKKNIPSLKVRRTLYVLVISFFIYGFGFHLISDLPRLVNRDFDTESGEIREITETKEGRYDITLEDAGKIRSYRDIHGEGLTKGEHIMIVCSPNPLYADLGVKTNNSITELYLQYYGSNSIEKVYVIFYCFLNFLVQAREFRKIKNNAGDSWRKRIYVAWKAALYLFTFALLFSLANMIDNFIIGMFIGAMYVLYNMCYLVLHVSRQS